LSLKPMAQRVKLLPVNPLQQEKLASRATNEKGNQPAKRRPQRSRKHVQVKPMLIMPCVVRNKGIHRHWNGAGIHNRQHANSPIAKRLEKNEEKRAVFLVEVDQVLHSGPRV